MKHRSFFVIVASVASFLLLLYFVMVGYLFFARPADCAVVDWDLSIRPKMVPDCENKYIAYLALTNLTLTSDVSVLLSELHNVAACPQYQGPTNNILQLWTINEVSHIVDSAIGSLVKSGRYEDAAVAIYDWYTFAKSCCETSSSTVELVAGCGMCNMVYQEIENLALDEKVPEMILGTLSDIVNNEQNFKNLFERALKCEYSFWVKPGFEKLKQTPDQRELLARIENAFAPEGGGVVAQTLARVLACTPGYERFSYNNGATLQHVATVFRGAKLDVENRTLDVSHIGVFEPNWFGRQAVSCVSDNAVKVTRQTLKRNAMFARLARIIVALQLYARKHNMEYPSSLDDLVPGFMSEVPRDPFDEDYEINYDCAARLIWSVGENHDYTRPPDNAKIDKRNFLIRARRVDAVTLQ